MKKKIIFGGILSLALLLGTTAPSFAAVFISVNIAPPALPVYTQPVCPGPGYLWTPGYWAWDPAVGQYYWVPGTWVLAPQPGYLWTPGYWGWSGGAYAWHAGYWGPHVGFYGGVNYGFGYVGTGFVGGEWRGGSFFYNSAVVNVDRTRVTNVYVNKTVIVNNNVTVNRVSYNGGNGGIQARPTQQEQAFAHEQHIGPTVLQQQHVQAAHQNPAMFANANHGHPAVAAVARPAARPEEFNHMNAQNRPAAAHAPQPQPHAQPAQTHAFANAPSHPSQPESRPAYQGHPEGHPAYQSHPTPHAPHPAPHMEGGEHHR